ncbi:MAG: SusD/RagB family nutrient-binding outer membrane lipoprotein [Bacteroidota bacterium]|nr:SusD/RagB family nutrient-binding outer membrane lipoprotein [Bacteroidota bacterium]
MDVNTNPNYATSDTPEMAFTSAVGSTASVIGGQYNIMGCIWCQYWTQSNAANQYKDIDRYNMTDASFNNQFTRIYSGALKDYKYAEENAAASNNWSIYLMSTLMEAYTYQMMADLYDQIPYKEACLGDSGILHPHYDKGQAVYDDLILKINNALAKPLNKLSSTQAAQDLLFDGKMTKWLQFANTLKLKIYLRQLYVTNRKTIVENGIKALFQDPNGFLDSDAALTQFSDEASKSNPTYEDNVRQLNVATNLRASSTLLFYLDSTKDTRLTYFFSPGSKGDYRALGQGDYAVASSIIDPTIISTANMSATDPVYFISKAESYFLQAEAAAYGKEMGWNLQGADDQKAYEAGVAAAFDKYGLDATSFITTGGVYEYPSAGNFEAKQKAIITQKWLSMVGSEGMEMVFEHNRTHYPAENFNVYSMVQHTNQNPVYVAGTFVKPASAVINSFPQRLLFPQYEHERNPNCPADVPITTKVWWATKP